MSRGDNDCQCMSLADQRVREGGDSQGKPSLSQSNFLHFHEVFEEKIGQNNGLTPHLRCWRIALEILDPPLYEILIDWESWISGQSVGLQWL